VFIAHHRIMPRLLALLPLLLLAACRDGAPEAPVATAQAPVEQVGQLHEDRFALDWTLAPDLAAARPTVIAYTPRMADGSPLAALDTVHDKLSHLIIVSRDLSYFDHVHAERTPEGRFALPYVFPAAGPYVLFADYTPKGANTQLFRHEVSVGGTAPAPQPLGPATNEVTVDGMTVALGLPEGGLRPGAHVSLTFRVRDTAGDVTDIEPYLGAGGHVVVIPETSNGFLHVHPEEAMGGAHSHSGSHGAHDDGPPPGTSS
jgi:hypothetical protein